MVVQHNLTAMNSNRMLGITTGTQAKSTEKLSSGYKINRAADDAAGLSISEKMRKQIRGLTQASLNAEDGISSVQTAEGALTEVHDMLQRMNELAVKAANGTMSEDDRGYIQDEIDQLVTEIDRVSTTTKFNETYLLKGVDGDGKAELTYTSAGTALGITLDDEGVGTVAVASGALTQAGVQTGSDATQTADVALTAAMSSVIDNVSYYLVTDVAGNKGLAFDDLVEEDDVKAFKTEAEFVDALESAYLVANGKDAKTATIANGTLTVHTFADVNSNLDFSLHVGADSEDANKIDVSITHMSARGLGVNGLRVDGDDDTNATAAIDTIAAAIQQVSTQRSALGAVQNRLEHTINNLDNIVENTTAAESQIRDTDMATEMVKYSNNNILAQAGQAMLAQANQANQGVLSLLG